MVARGTLTYLALFLLLRFVMKRQSGSLSTADILLIVVIADAAQNAFSKEYRSVSEGIVLVATILFWNFFLDWLAFRFPALGRFLEENPLPLVRNGRMIHRNMRREFISKDELLSQLRLQGVDDITQVKTACLEPDGAISVIKKPAGSGIGSRPRKRSPGAG